MPVYTYRCEDCGVQFDRRQKFSDDPITVCPECHGQVHRLIQPAGIIFKGSGFYVTDNKSSHSLVSSQKDKDGGESASGEKKPAAASGSKDDAKTSSAESGKSAAGSSSTNSSKTD